MPQVPGVLSQFSIALIFFLEICGNDFEGAKNAWQVSDSVRRNQCSRHTRCHAGCHSTWNVQSKNLDKQSLYVQVIDERFAFFTAFENTLFFHMKMCFEYRKPYLQ